MTILNGTQHRSGKAHQRYSLSQRRRIARIRGIAMAIFAALTLFFSLSAITGAQSTQTALVASHAIERGEKLTASDFSEQTIPANGAFSALLSHSEQAEGLIAQTNITAGSVLINSMIGKAPILPTGLTAVQARVTQSSSTVIAGDTVTLISPLNCEQSRQPGTPDAAVPRNPSGSGTCTLSKTALVLGEVKQKQSGESIAMEFALPPEEAATVSLAQQQSAIMVVPASSQPSEKQPPQ